jgi:hypothetical protein
MDSLGKEAPATNRTGKIATESTEEHGNIKKEIIPGERL